jgi:pimeloyl-ACP methyl ester carboxylesterase
MTAEGDMNTIPTTAGSARSKDETVIAYETLGVGKGMLVLGGAWRSGHDYLPFARALAPYFEVHLVDRRGRGGSGAQGGDYSIERETGRPLWQSECDAGSSSPAPQSS